MPFKKGQSGNPGGRVGMPPEVRKAFQELTTEAARVLKGIMQDEKAPPASRVQAAEKILARAWGQPEASLDLKADVRSFDASKLTDDQVCRLAAIQAEIEGGK